MSIILWWWPIYQSLHWKLEIFREFFTDRKDSYVSLGYEPVLKSMHQTIPVHIFANFSQPTTVKYNRRNVILVQKTYWSNFESQYSNKYGIVTFYNLKKKTKKNPLPNPQF